MANRPAVVSNFKHVRSILSVKSRIYEITYFVGKTLVKSYISAPLQTREKKYLLYKTSTAALTVYPQFLSKISYCFFIPLD